MQLPAQYQQFGWNSSIRAAVVQQLDTDLDKGGSYSSSRVVLGGGYGYRWGYRRSISLSAGYNYNGYNFSGSSGFAGLRPWEDVHSFSLGLPIRWGINKKWTTFLVPSLRVSGEKGASVSDSITGGGFLGAAYQYSKNLTIGPGIGVVTQLEDSASIFPILIINWKITDKWSIGTGKGFGATLGPGLNLSYQLNDKWSFTMGGRFERLRFRLDNDNTVRSGIGEDTSVPLYFNCNYTISPKMSINLLGGVELDGDLKLENRHGKVVSQDSYENGSFVGVTFSLRQ